MQSESEAVSITTRVEETSPAPTSTKKVPTSEETLKLAKPVFGSWFDVTNGIGVGVAGFWVGIIVGFGVIVSVGLVVGVEVGVGVTGGEITPWGIFTGYLINNKTITIASKINKGKSCTIPF